MAQYQAAFTLAFATSTKIDAQCPVAKPRQMLRRGDRASAIFGTTKSVQNHECRSGSRGPGSFRVMEHASDHQSVRLVSNFFYVAGHSAPNCQSQSTAIMPASAAQRC